MPAARETAGLGFDLRKDDQGGIAADVGSRGGGLQLMGGDGRPVRAVYQIGSTKSSVPPQHGVPQLRRMNETADAEKTEEDTSTYASRLSVVRQHMQDLEVRSRDVGTYYIKDFGSKLEDTSLVHGNNAPGHEGWTSQVHQAETDVEAEAAHVHAFIGAKEPADMEPEDSGTSGTGDGLAARLSRHGRLVLHDSSLHVQPLEGLRPATPPPLSLPTARTSDSNTSLGPSFTSMSPGRFQEQVIRGQAQGIVCFVSPSSWIIDLSGMQICVRACKRMRRVRHGNKHDHSAGDAAATTAGQPARAVSAGTGSGAACFVSGQCMRA